MGNKYHIIDRLVKDFGEAYKDRRGGGWTPVGFMVPYGSETSSGGRIIQAFVKSGEPADVECVILSKYTCDELQSSVGAWLDSDRAWTLGDFAADGGYMYQMLLKRNARGGGGEEKPKEQSEERWRLAWEGSSAQLHAAREEIGQLKVLLQNERFVRDKFQKEASSLRAQLDVAASVSESRMGEVRKMLEARRDRAFAMVPVSLAIADLDALEREWEQRIAAAGEQP